MGWRLENSLGGAHISITDVVWEYENKRFEENDDFKRDELGLPVLKFVGKSFYDSTNFCPHCKKHLLKSNAGLFVGICTTHGSFNLKSVFACDTCKTFYASYPGKLLSDGQCFVMNDKMKFNKVFQIIDKYAIEYMTPQQMYQQRIEWENRINNMSKDEPDE